MKPLEMEAFLTIVRLGNITKAARFLFISQSTLSQRLQSLERELDADLIVRNKGMIYIKLTPEGEKFLKIATKWEQLMTEARNIKGGKSIETITIGAVDSVHNFILQGFYRYIHRLYPEKKLVIKTHQSSEIYSLLEQKEIDIGFPLQERVIKNISVKNFFVEDMVLIKKRRYGKITTISNSELIPEYEVYINWGLAFSGWHEKWWGSEGTYGTQVDTASLLLEFIDNVNSWAIVPISMARHLQETKQIDILPLIDPPPKRECFIVFNRDSEKQALISEYLSENQKNINGLVKL